MCRRGEPLFRLDGRYVDDQSRPLMAEKQIMVGSRCSIALWRSRVQDGDSGRGCHWYMLEAVLFLRPRKQ